MLNGQSTNLKNQLTWKVFMAILLNDVADCFAQIFMKKGLGHAEIHMGSLASLCSFMSHNLTSPLLWLGIAIYAANFFLWIIVLSRIELSVAVPLGSTMYAIVPVFAIVCLHEIVPPLRWLGVLFIMAGIYFVSKSDQIFQKKQGVL